MPAEQLPPTNDEMTNLYAESLALPPTSDEMTDLYAESLATPPQPHKPKEQTQTPPVVQTEAEPVPTNHKPVAPEEKESEKQTEPDEPEEEVVDSVIISDEEYGRRHKAKRAQEARQSAPHPPKAQRRTRQASGSPQTPEKEKRGPTREQAQQIADLLNTRRTRMVQAEGSEKKQTESTTTPEADPIVKLRKKKQRGSKASGEVEQEPPFFFDGNQRTSKTIYHRDRSPENTSQVDEKGRFRALKIAYHGARAAIARIRLIRAEETASRMEQKNKFYKSIGQAALTNKEIPDDLQPNTIVEQFVGHRLNKRRLKKIEADNRAHTENRNSRLPKNKHPSSTFGKSVRQSAIDRSLGVVLRDRDSGPSVSSSIAYNTKALIVGPELKGTGSLGKKLRRAKNTAEFVTLQKNAAKWQQESVEIKSVQPKYGSKAHRKARRMKRRADERLEHMAEMPITSRWRDMRFDRAEKRADKMEDKIQKHRDAIKELKK